MDKYAPHENLIDCYLGLNDLPYKSKFEKPDITICREFEIVSPSGLCRFDIILINHSDKRYDILEFKSRPLLLKDAYQIYRYMKCFIYNQTFGTGLNKEYSYCFHLIGEDHDDERIDNLILMESPTFKFHVYYLSNKALEVYEQSPFNVSVRWI